jgi:hypothetical protein
VAWEWVTPVATGVVGVAGIVGNVWTATSGRRSQAELLRGQLDGESRRAYRADKQALYSKALHELTLFMETSFRMGKLVKGLNLHDEAPADFVSAAEAMSAQMIGVTRLRAEVAVVAGPKLGKRIGDIIYWCSVFAEGKGDGTVSPLLDDLTKAMHADLTADL